MKRLFAFTILTLFANFTYSQDLTGIWRGTFFNVRDMLIGGSRYRYEVQVNNKDKSVKGVTYSYQTTRFYGKASLVGVWNADNSNLILKEEKMEDLKIQGGGEGCLMTCYLDYRKEGDREILEGTYTSRNMNNGNDCGGGKVFLERVPDSDFEKEDFLKDKDKATDDKPVSGKVKPGQEDFLVKKPETKPATPKKPIAKAPVKKPVTPPATAKAAPKTSKPPVSKPGAPVAKATPPANNAQKSPVQKPVLTKPKKPAEASARKVIPPPAIKKIDSSGKEIAVAKPGAATDAKPVSPATKPQVKVPAPPILKQRQNELFETITTAAKEITISFYDNGEIDGDTISVYDNNRLLVKSKGLSAKPISITVQLDEDEQEHEIVMVAENLGSIPPNTALMIVNAGSQRYNVRLSSNEQKNAMVRFRFKPFGEQE